MSDIIIDTYDNASKEEILEELFKNKKQYKELEEILIEDRSIYNQLEEMYYDLQCEHGQLQEKLNNIKELFKELMGVVHC